jgi:hypothetical protein
MAENRLQQPNFQLITQCHQSLAAELSKCRNIPAFDGAAAILAAIQQLGLKIDGLELRMKAA